MTDIDKISAYEQIFWMLAHDVIFVHTYNDEINLHDDGFHFAINCGDVFYYASADAEAFPLQDIYIIRQLYQKYGYDGLVAYIAYKRKILPLVKLQTIDYNLAYKELEQHVSI